MKKSVLVIAVALLSLSTVAVYAANPVKDDMAERVRLSKDLHDIRNIRERINGTISGVSQGIPPADRVDFEEYIRVHVNYDDLESKSIQYAAETYTAPELKAMIAYFGSADGQSAEAKGPEFGAKIGKDIMKEIDAAMVAAKYDGVSNTPAPVNGGKLQGLNVSPDLLDTPKK